MDWLDGLWTIERAFFINLLKFDLLWICQNTGVGVCVCPAWSWPRPAAGPVSTLALCKAANIDQLAFDSVAAELRAAAAPAPPPPPAAVSYLPPPAPAPAAAPPHTAARPSTPAPATQHWLGHFLNIFLFKIINTGLELTRAAHAPQLSNILYFVLSIFWSLLIADNNDESRVHGRAFCISWHRLQNYIDGEK